MHPRILLAEDDPIQRKMLKRILQNEMTFEIVEAADGVEAMKHLKNASSNQFNLVLVDLQMPGLSGIDLIKQTAKNSHKILFIVISGSEDISDAVDALKHGAIDFITKPAQPERLVTSVKNALAIQKLQEQVNSLQKGQLENYSFDDISRITPGLKDQIALSKKAANSDIPVVITGESGVGKEVFAIAIHKESKRSGKPFISVNCGALPENLVESTLFGHEKGSFTGAISRSLGKCREADNGVLFLDEIGELKLETQVKLLRMLQQGEIEPVGSGKPIKVNVRIISATNRSLEQLVAQGKFREDLYYRLHGLPLHIPALRERPEDITTLAKHFLQQMAIKETRAKLELSEAAMKSLSSYSWPGNVRELQHLISRAVLLSDNDLIEVETLAKYIKPGISNDNSKSASIGLYEKDGHLKTLNKIEQEVIELALDKYNNHVGKAATALGVGQSTLYKRMKKIPELEKYLNPLQEVKTFY